MPSLNPLLAFAALRHLPRAIWVTAVASFINRAGTMALPFLLLFLVEERHYAAVDAGKFLALFGMCAFVAGPISGRLVDRYGTKNVMVLSFLGAGTLVTLVPFTHGTLPLALAVAGWAFANETFRPAVLAHIGASVSPEQMKQAFALNRWAVNLGMSIGPAAGGLLASKAFSLVFIVDGATSLAAMVVFAIGLPAVALRKHGHEQSGTALSPLRDPRFLPLLVGLVPLYIVLFQLESTVPLYVVDHLHIPMKSYGFLAMINTVIIVTAEIPLNHSTAHWPQRRALVVGTVCFALGFACYAFATTFMGLALVTAVWTVGEMMVMPAVSTYVAGIAGDHNRGAYMGLYTLTASSAFVIAPWVGTTLFEAMAKEHIWWVFGAMALVSAALFARVQETAI